LKDTAIFIGGSDVAAAENLLDAVRAAMLPQFGLRVSVLFDANGANTTAAAALRAAARHIGLKGVRALILAATGPVGQRIARLLAAHGAEVRLGSREQARAQVVCERIRQRIPAGRLEPVSTGTLAGLETALKDRELLIAAGAAGIELLPATAWSQCSRLKVAIDLNAVPPAGIQPIAPADKATERDGVICYGALGIGGIKMKIHKAAVMRLFERNDQILDAEEIEALGEKGTG
jgi:hypothetical protein